LVCPHSILHLGFLTMVNSLFDNIFLEKYLTTTQYAHCANHEPGLSLPMKYVLLIFLFCPELPDFYPYRILTPICTPKQSQVGATPPSGIVWL